GIRDFGSRPTIIGNLIGTDATGLNALGNGQNGILIIAASFVTIGGTAAGSRNVISGNAFNGIGFSETPSFLVIQGNYIGTDATGVDALGNGVDGIGGAQFKNTIGGTATGAGNVISGNKRFGINLDSDGTSNLVQGNFVGTDFTGTRPLGNA